MSSVCHNCILLASVKKSLLLQCITSNEF
jgi:hypothetical protein